MCSSVVQAEFEGNSCSWKGRLELVVNIVAPGRCLLFDPQFRKYLKRKVVNATQWHTISL